MSRIGMFRLSCFGIFIILGSSVAPGCDAEEEAPIEQRLCERFDGCNYFSAGLDVDDCTDIVTMCSESLVRSRREDWVSDAEDALGRNNCGNFLETYQQASACTISPAGTVSTEGGTPQDPSGGNSSDPGTTPSGPGGGVTCGGEDVFACSGADTITGCLDGEPFSIDCLTVCDGDMPDGCGFDEERGHDVCFCIVQTEDPEPEPEPPGGPGPAPGE